MSGGQTLQIESAVQCTCISASPAKGICRCSEGFSGVLAHNCFGNYIGYRLIRQDFVIKIGYHTQAKAGHIHINGSVTDLLAGFSSLSVQRQFQLSVIAQCILSVNVKFVGIGVTHLVVFRVQIIFGCRTGRTDITEHFAVQHNDQLGICAVSGDIADDIAVCILTPCPNCQIGFGFVDDFLTVNQIGFDFDVVLTTVLIGDVHGEMVSIAAVIQGIDFKGIFAGLAIFQKQRDLSLCSQCHGSAAAGLIAGHGCDGYRSFLTYQGHGVGKHSVRQLIIINRFSGLTAGILAGDLPCDRYAVFLDGVFHLQGQIRRIVEIDYKGDPLSADHCGDRDVICIGSRPLRHRKGQRTALFQIAASTGFGSIGHT